MMETVALIKEIERLKAENEKLKTDLFVSEVNRRIFHQQRNKKQSQYEMVMDEFIKVASNCVYYSQDLKCCVVPFHNLKDIKEMILAKKGLW